jgi:hypothetical protein
LIDANRPIGWAAAARRRLVTAASDYETNISLDYRSKPC